MSGTCDTLDFMSDYEKIAKTARGHVLGLINSAEIKGTAAESWLRDLVSKNHPTLPYIAVYTMCFPDGSLRLALTSLMTHYRIKSKQPGGFKPYTFLTYEDYDEAFSNFTESELFKFGEFFKDHRYFPTVEEIIKLTEYRNENAYFHHELIFPLIFSDYEEITQYYHGVL